MKTATNSLEDINATVDTTKHRGFFRSLFAFAGPAYLVSVGYMDPGNWATDIAAGSAFNYSLVWILLMSNLMALLLQSLSARLGVVRRLDLAQASREMFPSFINIPLYVLAEIAIAACDLAEVLGMAIGLNLLFHLPLLWGVSITVLDSLLLLLLLQWGVRKMEAIIVTLVLVIGMSFFVEIFIAQPDTGALMKGFIPHGMSNAALYIAIGVIGATVMPHNLYLHSALVQTRRIDQSEKGIRRALRFNFIDSTVALNLAFLVNSSILILAAAVFYRNGFYEIADIQDAHHLLEPLLGTALAPILFGVALVASGQSSTITGTLAGQVIMEGYLHLRITPWLRRLITRLLAVVPAFLVIWLMGEDKTGDLLILSQVILSMQLGFAVIPLIHFTSDKKKMGAFAIKPWVKILAWASAIIIVSLNVKLVFEEILSLFAWAGDKNWWVWCLVVPVVLFSGLLLLYTTFYPLLQKQTEKQPVPPQNIVPIKIQSTGQFKRVAVTVDFSFKDQAAINTALMQGGMDADYFLIHILESPSAFFSGKQADDFESAEDIESLKRYAAALTAAGYSVQFRLGYGKRSQSIAELVNAWKPEILVMGAHGHRGLKDIIFGETISRVKHLVHIPILVV